MKLLDSLLPALSRLGAKPSQAAVQLTFSPPLTPALKAELAKLPANTPLTLTPSGTGPQLKLQLPSGVTLTATAQVPLPPGVQVQITPEDILTTSPKPNAPTQAQTIPVKLLPQSVTTAPVQSATQPQPAAPQPVLVQSENAPITHAELRTLHTTTLLQITSQKAPETNLPQLPTKPQTLLPMPPGPVAATLPPKLPTALLGQPLILTPSGPMLDNGTQNATLTPAISTPGQPPQRTPVTLNLGVHLAVTRPFTAIILPPAPAATLQHPQATQPVLFLTGPQASPVLPQPAPPQLTIQLPPQPAQPTNPVPQNIDTPALPIAARILPPQPGQLPTQHTALLATGTTIVLKSPQPLPTGSIIVADFPITPTSGIQRVLPADSQAPQQQGTGIATHQAAPVPPQTPQAVLAAGMVIEGRITGQNEQGQPLLTITQPGALTGATVPLTLAEPTTLLPMGAQISIKVGDNLLATILGLTLPPQAQNAYTVNTLGTQWNTLQQALQTLQQQAPMQAANLRASLPQLANLLPGLIQFTNALRTNRAEDAFDTEATRLLKSMGIDLSSDLSQLSQLQQRPTSSDPQWRGTIFPYVEAPGEDPRQGGFFWRREKSDNPRGSTSTRFIVEVEMSQLGAMQLDGLITYPEIWLKLRRTSYPEPGFTEGLQTLVTTLLQRSGLTGGIAVETTATFPVNPKSELLAQTENPLPTSA